jgi:hypothetical protein
MRRVFVFTTCLLSALTVGRAQETEQTIQARDKAANGILVSTPKVYDDSLLQRMLQAAEAKLASMQVLDASGLSSHLGAVTGANQQFSSLAVSAMGPTLPQVVKTANAATQSNETDSSVVTGATPSTTNSTKSVGTAPVTNVATTTPQTAPPTVTAPAPTTTLPSAFSVSSSDVLNEQMQLTYEVANLRLLLEGSLTDRMLFSSKLRLTKPRTTLGFPIAIVPDKRFRNAVAVVEVDVKKNQDVGDGEPPVVTALLPREKTYNVAAIKDSSHSLGGGVATQLLSVSASFLWGRRTYYVVQDQDTLALSYPALENDRVRFQWQFRPVLGQEYVRSGMKQTFVQLAFPGAASDAIYGRILVRTYWRRYDRKTGVVGDVIVGSLRESVLNWPIPHLHLEIAPSPFSGAQLEDLGNGQVLVHLPGNFLSDTYVRIGSTQLRFGSPNFSYEQSEIRFVAPIVDLATKDVALVARDGSAVPLVIPHLVPAKPAPIPKPPPIIKNTEITAVDEASSRLTLTLQNDSYAQDDPRLLLIMGGKVFGYSDAPIERSGTTVSVTVPTTFLIANPVVQLRPLFADPDYRDRVSLSSINPLSQTERLVLLDQTKSTARFLLYGSRLTDLHVLSPSGVAVKNIGGPSDVGTLAIIELTADQLKSGKQILIERKQERPILLPIPTVDFKDAQSDPPKPAERVVVNTDQVILQGSGLSSLDQVLFEGKRIPFDKVDAQTVRLKGLRGAGVTSSATTQPLELTFKGSKATVKVEIVTAKEETVAK